MTLDEAGAKLVSLGFENAGRQAAPRGLERTTYRGSPTKVFSSNIIEILHSGDDILAIRNLLDATRERTTGLADMREALFRLGGTSTTRFEGRGWEMSVYRGSNSEPDCATYPATLTNRNVALDYGAAWVGRGPHCADGSITFVAFDADRRGQPVRFVATVLYDFGDGLPAVSGDSRQASGWQTKRGVASFDTGLAYVSLPASNGFILGVGCEEQLDLDPAPALVLMAREDVDNAQARRQVFGNPRELGPDGIPVHMPPASLSGQTAGGAISRTLSMSGVGGLLSDGLADGRLFTVASFPIDAATIADIRAATQLQVGIAGQTFDVPTGNAVTAVGGLACLATESGPTDRQAYEALSTTAMGVTGSMTILGESFTFAEGQTVVARPIGIFDLNGNSAQLFEISIYKTRTAQELCGVRPSYLSLTERVNGVVSLAFYEADPRRAGGRLRGACAVYNYSAS